MNALNPAAHANANAFHMPMDFEFVPDGFCPENTAPLGVAGSGLGWGDLVPHRDDLVRFARRKLQDPALAEDVVHDVFEAVVSGRAHFEGRAQLRSWLTAILKNKLVDLIRQRARHGDFGGFQGDEVDDASGDDAMAQLESPEAGPQEVAEQRELLRQALRRIDALPAGLRDVMQFRVLQDETSEEVCQRLHISESSLFVRLHRARKQLLC